MNRYAHADYANVCETVQDRKEADFELRRRIVALPFITLSSPDPRLEVLDCWITPNRTRVFKLRLIRNGRHMETQ